MRDTFRMFKYVALLSFFYSCTRPNEVVRKETRSSYIAINGSDTAWLKLVVIGTTFKGKCAINFNNRYIDSGDVKGRVFGDTLLGDFHYLHYGLEWKRIAFALLKRNNKLIMGEGDQGEYLSIPYFKPDHPVRFDSVRFVFQKTISNN